MLDNPRSPPQQLPGGRARERAGGAGRQGGRAAGGQDRHAHQVGSSCSWHQLGSCHRAPVTGSCARWRRGSARTCGPSWSCCSTSPPTPPTQYNSRPGASHSRRTSRWGPALDSDSSSDAEKKYLILSECCFSSAHQATSCPSPARGRPAGVARPPWRGSGSGLRSSRGNCSRPRALARCARRRRGRGSTPRPSRGWSPWTSWRPARSVQAKAQSRRGFPRRHNLRLVVQIQLEK